jgi:hypothetical protein
MYLDGSYHHLCNIFKGLKNQPMYSVHIYWLLSSTRFFLRQPETLTIVLWRTWYGGACKLAFAAVRLFSLFLFACVGEALAPFIVFEVPGGLCSRCWHEVPLESYVSTLEVAQGIVVGCLWKMRDTSNGRGFRLMYQLFPAYQILCVRCLLGIVTTQTQSPAHCSSPMGTQVLICRGLVVQWTAGASLIAVIKQQGAHYVLALRVVHDVQCCVGCETRSPQCNEGFLGFSKCCGEGAVAWCHRSVSVS